MRVLLLSILMSCLAFGLMAQEKLSSDRHPLLTEWEARSIDTLWPDYSAKIEKEIKLLYKEKNYQAAIELLSSFEAETERLSSQYPTPAANQYYFAGRCYFSIGNKNKALANYEKALKSLEQQAVSIPLLQDLYYRIGSLKLRQLNYTEANEYLNHALKLAEKFKASSKTKIKIVQSLMLAYRFLEQCDTVFALEKIGLTFTGLSPAQKIETSRYSLDCLIKDGKLEKAKLLSVQSIDYYTNNPSAISQLKIAASYHSLGSILKDQNQPENAGVAFDSALHFSQAHFKRKDRETARFYISKGDLEAEIGQNEAALSSYHKALLQVVTLFENPDVTSFPLVKNLSSEPFIMTALRKKATVFLAHYKQTKDTTFLKLTLAAVKLAISVTDHLRAEYLESAVNRHLSEYSYSIFETGLEACYLLQKETGNTLWTAEAFRLMEQSKVITLQRSLQEQQLEDLLPPEYVARGQYLKNQFLTIKNNKEPEAKKNVIAIKRELQNWTDSLEIDFPKYYRLKNTFHPSSIQEIKKLLPNDETVLVEYYWGTKSLFALLLSKHQVFFTRLPNQNEIERLCDNLLQGQRSYANSTPKAQASIEQEYRLEAHKLYEYLLTPLFSKLAVQPSSMVVIADGELNYLPFEILLTAAVDNQLPFGQWPYLLKKAAISYYPSASLLTANDEQFSLELKRYAGFAPSYENTSLPNPVSSHQQIKATTALLEGQFFAKEKSDKNAFLAALPKHSIVDFGGHAFFAKDAFQNSGILFPDSKGKIDTLVPLEIYRMSKSPGLVLLGACQTGDGLVQSGEGLRSMAQAFLFSGSQSILASLWDAEDYTLSVIKSSFFQHLIDGDPAHSAINKAKRDFLQEDRFRDRHFPAYWGGMIMTTSPVQKRSAFPWSWLLAAFALGIAAFFCLIIRY